MGFFGGGGASVDLASPPAIGNTTPNTGAFTTLNTSNIFGSGSPDGGVAIRNTSTATNFVEFITGVGFFKNSNNIIASINRSSTKSFVTTSDGFFGWGSSTTNADAATPNASLFSDAANILAQRKGTAAQTFRLYNTFTDASNYERASIGWTSNIFVISPEKAGTGSVRYARYFLGHNGSSMTSFIEGYGTNGVNIAAGGASFVWFFNTGSLTNEYAFGGDVIIGGRQVGGGNSNFSSPRLKLQGGAGTGSGTGGEVWAEGSLTRASGTTQHTVYELFRGYITTADQPMFSIGGKTSSFPALKRSSALIQVRLADDSAYTTLDAQLRLQGTAPATAGATGTAGDIRYDANYIYICTATNTWKRVAIATWP